MSVTIRFVLATGLVAWIAAGQAHAQVFKCAGHDGTTSFSSTPCTPDKGNAEYLGENRRSLPENSSEVVTRSTPAPKIIESEPRPQRPFVTVVRDSSKPLSPSEIGELNRKRRMEAGLPEPVRTRCYSSGNMTNCRSSDGGRTNTYHLGNQSFINGRSADGTPIRGTTTRFGNHSSTSIRE